MGMEVPCCLSPASRTPGAGYFFNRAMKRGSSRIGSQLGSLGSRADEYAMPPFGEARMRSRSGTARSASPMRLYRSALTPLHTARSEEHTSELQSLMRSTYAVFCLKKK